MIPRWKYYVLIWTILVQLKSISDQHGKERTVERIKMVALSHLGILASVVAFVQWHPSLQSTKCKILIANSVFSQYLQSCQRSSVQCQMINVKCQMSYQSILWDISRSCEISENLLNQTYQIITDFYLPPDGQTSVHLPTAETPFLTAPM